MVRLCDNGALCSSGMSFWVDPRDEVIGVMMTQIDPSGHLKLRDEFHRLVNESIRRP